MANLYYDVKVDIQKDIVIDSGLRFTQGDSKVIYLRLKVMNGGNKFDAINTTPSVNFVKPDGTYVVGVPIESGDFWIYQFLGNELQSAGKVLCDIKFTYESGRVSSSKFTFIVEKDTTISKAEASSSYISPMEELLGEMRNYKNQGYDLVTAAESWANGGTGTREDEDTNNAKYWSEKAEEAAKTVAQVYSYKGSVPTYADLPSNNQRVGDVWNVIDTDMNYAWDGSDWDALGGSVNAGDMYKSVYDTNDDGVVDKADALIDSTGATLNADEIRNELSKINTLNDKTQNLDNNGTLDFSNVSNKPNSISGYGISDAYTKSEVYSKSETYTQAEVQSLISQSGGGVKVNGTIDFTSITASTADISAGATPLTSGQLYVVYE